MTKKEYKKFLEDLRKDMGSREVEKMLAMTDEDIEREHIAFGDALRN